MKLKPAAMLCSLGLLTFGWLTTTACRTVPEPVTPPSGNLSGAQSRTQPGAQSEPQYALRLKCAPAVLVLGEEVRCTLTIAEAGGESPNPEFENAMSLLRRSVAHQDGKAGFQRSFHRQPEAVGIYVVDPFELSFEGQKLVSNRAEVTVLETPPEGQPVTLSVSPGSLRVDDAFELFLSQTSQVDQRLTLEGDDALELKSLSTRTQVVNGVISYSAIYQATARQPGRLEIGREFYRGLPEDVQVPVLVLEIEPRQR